MSENTSPALEHTFRFLDNGGMEQVSSSEPAMIRKKRLLDYTKCSHCRRDKKKCTPQGRVWPEQKCDRCELKGFPCSPNETIQNLGQEAADGRGVPRDLPHTISRTLLGDKFLVELQVRAANIIAATISNWKALFALDEKSLKNIREFAIPVAVSAASSARETFNHSMSTLLDENRENQDYRTTNYIFLSYIFAWGDRADKQRFNDLVSHDVGFAISHAAKLSKEGAYEMAEALLRALADEMLRRTTVSGMGVSDSSLLRVMASIQDSLEAFVRTRFKASFCSNKTGYTIPSMATTTSPIMELLDILCFGRTEGEFLDRNHCHIAAESGYSLAVQQALQRLPNATISRDCFNRTPLHIACEKNHGEVVTTLMKANPVAATCRTVLGLSPLHFAAANGATTIINALLADEDWRQQQLSILDDFGRSALTYAAMHGHRDAVRILASRGPDMIVRKDGYGRSPISYAAQNGHEWIVMQFLSVGGALYEIFEPDKQGLTAMDHAKKNGHTRIQSFLKGEWLLLKDRRQDR